MLTDAGSSTVLMDAGWCYACTHVKGGGRDGWWVGVLGGCVGWWFPSLGHVWLACGKGVCALCPLVPTGRLEAFLEAFAALGQAWPANKKNGQIYLRVM